MDNNYDPNDMGKPSDLGGMQQYNRNDYYESQMGYGDSYSTGQTYSGFEDTGTINNQNLNQNINKGNTPGFNLLLVLGIIQVLGICCCNMFTFIFGVLTIVFAVKADEDYKSGRHYYYENLKTAKVFNIIGWVFFVTGLFISIIGGILFN